MHHFISYSSADAQEFALTLADALEAGSPPISAWLDKRKLHPGDDWDTQIDLAIRTCEALIFILSKDSVEDHSVCKNEWVRALRFKKPLVLVRFHSDAELPFRLSSRQYIEVSPNFDFLLARLRQHLRWLTQPEGQLHGFRERLTDAERDLRRASNEEIPRIQKEIQDLKQQIEALQPAVQDPDAAAAKTQQSIEVRLENERQPERPITGQKRTKFVNPPPMVAPQHFQDRHVETELIGEFLKDESCRLMIIVGRGGVGKTAMVCRLLKALERGQLPDDLGPLILDGIVYLSQIGSHHVNVPNIFADLCRLLPVDSATRLSAIYRDAQKPTRDKLFTLLEQFQDKPIVVLLDNLEHLLDPEKRQLMDADLQEALVATLEAPHHQVKFLITTRLTPQDLPLVQPQRQRSLALDEGLQSPFAEHILRALDADGAVGLKAASDTVLNDVRIRTRGFPRALEAFYGVLAADRSTTLSDLLAQAAHTLPENVVETLVGEAFSRLDSNAQKVMQALAVYARPVPPVAVDYLLQPYWASTDSAPVLNRLVNMHFVRKEQGRYYLHPVDLAYALGRTFEGTPADREAKPTPFNQFAMRNRAAEFFRQTQLPRSEWKSLADLEPQLAEFEMRYAGQDYETAALLLDEIDHNYLKLWGHYRLVISLRESLLGRLGDGAEQTDAFNLGALGAAYWRLALLPESIRAFEQALSIVSEIGDRFNEGVFLGNMGLAYGDRGQVSRAIDLFEQDLAISREFGDRLGESTRLTNLALTYENLGEMSRSLEYTEQALSIARDIGDRREEGSGLNNLGLAFLRFGQNSKAIGFCQQSLTIVRELGDRYNESLNLTYIGTAHMAVGERCLTEFQEALQIAEEIGNAEARTKAAIGLTTARLLAEQLDDAQASAQAAREANYTLYLPATYALLGVVSIRCDAKLEAQNNFAEAIRQADALLMQTPQLYAALEAKGLSLCGLALCEGSRHLVAALECYRAARVVTSADGVVQQALLLFDVLALADTTDLLASVRSVVAGESPA